MSISCVRVYISRINFHRVIESIYIYIYILQSRIQFFGFSTLLRLYYTENVAVRQPVFTFFLPLSSNGNVSLHIRPDTRNVLQSCQYTFLTGMRVYTSSDSIYINIYIRRISEFTNLKTLTCTI